MLYLTRKIGQSIIINDKIEVKIIEVKGKNVKIGVEFPKNATVLRGEVYEKIVEQNIASSKSTINDDMGFFAAVADELGKDGNKK